MITHFGCLLWFWQPLEEEEEENEDLNDLPGLFCALREMRKIEEKLAITVGGINNLQSEEIDIIYLFLFSFSVVTRIKQRKRRRRSIVHVNLKL